MKLLQIIFLCFLQIYNIYAQDTTTTVIPCPKNETYNTCASSCQLTCKNMYMPIVCNDMCNAKCECKERLVRNKEGKCVERSDCPEAEIECPKNEEFSLCSNPCFPRTCSNRHVTANPLIKCRMVCIPGCKCKDGYIHDDITGSGCIPDKNCPKCEKNEVSTTCVNICAASCDDPNPSPSCAFLVCNPGCDCRKGFVKDVRAKKCVKLEQCSAIAEDEAE